MAQLVRTPPVLRDALCVKGTALDCLGRRNGDQMAPAQLCRQRRHNRGIWEGLGKLDHAALIAQLESPAKLLHKVLVQLVNQLRAVTGPRTTQYLGAGPLSRGPIQSGQPGIDGAAQALAAVGDQRAVRRAGCQARCLLFVPVGSVR